MGPTEAVTVLDEPVAPSTKNPIDSSVCKLFKAEGVPKGNPAPEDTLILTAKGGAIIIEQIRSLVAEADTDSYSLELQMVNAWQTVSNCTLHPCRMN